MGDETKYDNTGVTFPNGKIFFVLFYSMFDNKNSIKISQDLEDTLSIEIDANEDSDEYDFVDLSEPDTEYTVQSDSDIGVTGVVKIVPDEVPFTEGVDLLDQWWAYIYDPNDENINSGWVMVDHYDSTHIFFKKIGEAGATNTNSMDFSALTGYKIRYAVLAWYDPRDTAFKLAYASDGTNYEIIRWDGLNRSGNTFQLTGCDRAAEGSTQIDLTGKNIQYYPAIGSGTIIETFSGSDIAYDSTTGVYSANKSVNINIPKGSYISTSCCVAYVGNNGKMFRSNIVPIQYGGDI